MLEKSSQIAPLLVQLYESHNLYESLKENDHDSRRKIILEVANLVGVDLAPHEKEILSEVMVELLKQAEIDLRQAIAERLAVLDYAPLRVILQLANDDISVARPVLQNSPVLTDMDLIFIIKSKGSEYWQAVAQRADLSPEIVDTLVRTRDMETAIALTENQRATLTRHAVEVLAEMAADNAQLAKPLSQRREVPQALAQALYAEAARAIRISPATMSDRRARDSAEHVIQEFIEGTITPSPEVREAARQAAEKGILTPDYLMKPLQRGQMAAFIALFARYTGQTDDLVEMVVKNSSGKGMAVLCKLAGMEQRDFENLSGLIQRYWVKARGGDMADMSGIADYFSRLSLDEALQLQDKIVSL